MPTNLYGPGDNYELENSHVIPALIRKAHEAKESGSVAANLLFGAQGNHDASFCMSMMRRMRSCAS
jgi:nucleoside-diphosphate-sugar epimerase